MIHIINLNDDRYKLESKHRYQLKQITDEHLIQ